jgi:type I restriction enzyme S subunit
LEPKRWSPGKRFIYLAAKFFETEARQHLTGTSIPHADKNWFSQQLVCLPTSAQLLKVFHGTTDAFLRKSQQLRAECHTLEVVRDTLLPKLLSGELRVKDVDKLMEAHS